MDIGNDVTKIYIEKQHAQRILNGYPWVYNNEIQNNDLTKSLTPGQIVHLHYKNVPIAIGYFNKHSLISFRVLSWDPEEMIDVEFFCRRIQNALEVRKALISSPYYRLIHAEVDQLPGLIVDLFDQVLVVQINTFGMERLQPLLLEALQKTLNPKTIYLKKDSPVRQTEGLSLVSSEIVGESINTLEVIENETRFIVDLSSGQKTGWFYDHRENRKLIASLAFDKTMIDYFCYSGGFSIQAAKRGAKKVIGVDRSEFALENAKRSAALNEVQEICEFVCEETFKDMDSRILQNQTFDLVVLDPPAFVKSKKDLMSGLKGYEKLMTKGIQLTAPHGLLMIASCSYHVKTADLKTSLARALYKNKRQGRILKTLGAGVDHPLHPALEESAYLKGFLVVLD